jgi:hypothetical protein
MNTHLTVPIFILLNIMLARFVSTIEAYLCANKMFVDYNKVSLVLYTSIQMFISTLLAINNMQEC